MFSIKRLSAIVLYTMPIQQAIRSSYPYMRLCYNTQNNEVKQKILRWIIKNWSRDARPSVDSKFLMNEHPWIIANSSFLKTLRHFLLCFLSRSTNVEWLETDVLSFCPWVCFEWVLFFASLDPRGGRLPEGFLRNQDQDGWLWKIDKSKQWRRHWTESSRITWTAKSSWEHFHSRQEESDLRETRMECYFVVVTAPSLM